MQESITRRAAVSTAQRYASLDCLRGIAAITVVICHTIMLGLFQVEPLWSAVKWTPLRLLWSGHQAVILFFVLSGFSLFILFDSLAPSRARTVRFLLSRWLRLYPVYAASLLFALASYTLLALTPNTWPEPALYVPSPDISAKEFWPHFMLVGNFNTSLINPPIWSIVHEMRISIAFPLIFWLTERLAHRVALASTIGSLLIAYGCWTLPQTYGTPSAAMSLLSTVHYSTFFVVGALLAKYRLPLISWIRGHKGPWLPCVAAVALALYGYGYDEAWTSGAIMLGDLAVGVGAAALLLLAIAFPVLDGSRVLRFLGRISYSLYLVHFTCFGVVCVLFHGRVSNPILWGMVIALSLAVASTAWLLIERPALRWSRWVRPSRNVHPPETDPAIPPRDLRPSS
jgi:peptidoglycan/LPS O-acetylase OafA/YrhL